MSNKVSAIILVTLILIVQFSPQTIIAPAKSYLTPKTVDVSKLTSLSGYPNSLYGETVRGIEDVNHDGFGDFIVGGREYNNWQGKSWIYYGGP